MNEAPPRQGIRCGNRALHGAEVVYHDTVAQVRLCYHRTYGAAVLQDPEPRPAQPAEPVRPTTLAQAFRTSTAATPEPPTREPFEDFEATMNVTEVAAPPREPERPRLSKAELRERLASIPVGEAGKAYFALERDGDLKFYRVERDKGGFVSLAAQGGPTFYPVNFRNAVPILLAIAEDPERAGKRYADEVGRCMYCGLELTTEESRMYGMGPVCRRKRGVV